MTGTDLLPFIRVRLIPLTSRKFTDVCVASKRYRLVTLIHCQELVSFTSSCVIKYVAKNLLVLLVSC